MRFDFSLPKLLREGPGEFVHSYEVHHADLAFVALPSKTTGEKRQKQSLANILQTILAQPAAYADRVHIEDFQRPRPLAGKRNDGGRHPFSVGAG